MTVAVRALAAALLLGAAGCAKSGAPPAQTASEPATAEVRFKGGSGGEQPGFVDDMLANDEQPDDSRRILDRLGTVGGDGGGVAGMPAGSTAPAAPPANPAEPVDTGTAAPGHLAIDGKKQGYWAKNQPVVIEEEAGEGEAAGDELNTKLVIVNEPPPATVVFDARLERDEDKALAGKDNVVRKPEKPAATPRPVAREDAQKEATLRWEREGKERAEESKRNKGEAERRNREQARRLVAENGRPKAGQHAVDLVSADGTELALQEAPKPKKFLPRMFYFENTYLGGDAAHEEQVRRLDEALQGGARPYRLASAYPQPFDPPGDAGLGISASLDRAWLGKPGRVVLQVGLQGSQRYGWRRPPLDLVVVLDAPALTRDTKATMAHVDALVRQLGPQDRLGIVALSRRVEVLADVSRLRQLPALLPEHLDTFQRRPSGGPALLGRALVKAGSMLRAAAENQATVPGSQTVLIVTAGSDAVRVAAAARAAHDLTVQGVVTSVIELSKRHTGAWWGVAAAGHGNYHRFAAGAAKEAVAAELSSLSRVVARLIRVNIRLAPGVQASRVLGSRQLEEEEVRRVKAREVATDRELSRTLGVNADRGDDDDGIQTVIPYFYGGDSHVVLVELWVEGPGPVAEVSLRYKDMVRLDNATARTSVALASRPRPATAEHLLVRRNARGCLIAERLLTAAHRLQRGERDAALGELAASRRLAYGAPTEDTRMLAQFTQLVSEHGGARPAVLSEALRVAGQRKVGAPGRRPGKR